MYKGSESIQNLQRKNYLQTYTHEAAVLDICKKIGIPGSYTEKTDEKNKVKDVGSDSERWFMPCFIP